jgi:phosphoadenosine phosphosulfate reductase
VSGQVKGFTETQIQEMATRGAALDGTRPSDRWRRTEETFGDNYLVASNMPDAVLVHSAAQPRPAEDADSPSGRWQRLAKIECGLRAS